MALSQNDRQILRELGSRYMDFASLPVMGEKAELWKSLNRFQMQRPMVCIDQHPWHELRIDETLRCRVEDPVWRGVEWELRWMIYQWQHFPVDMVLEPFVTIPKAIRATGYGLKPEVERLELSQGTTAAAQHYTDVLNDYDDIGKITDLDFEVDRSENQRRMEQAAAIFDGIAPVVLEHGVQFHLGVWDYLTTLMSVENAYLNIIDRPEFIHACMERVTEATIAGIQKANALMIHNDIANRCHCSYVYTDDLLPAFGAGKGPVSQNSWAFGLAQLFTSVSPRVTEEFELPYITRMAAYFGSIYYGCCDRLDDRMVVVKRIPNVKKLSCSPWSDRERFAEKIGPSIILSNKPSPAFLASDSVNWHAVRADLRRTIDAAKVNHVNLEIILKDISTVRCEPERLTKWAEIAMEEVQNY